jgi:leader peptidase (prepilin peptidase)/N-methyltransferase
MTPDVLYNIYVTVMYVFLFLFGAAVGSFLNVCIYRLPKEESLIKSNSHCMTCGEYIKRRDLIPIISWCLLKGKCRACGAKISPRYTVVESLNAVGWVLISLRFDLISDPVWCIVNCLVYSALLVVFFMDWDTQLISTGVCIFIGILAVPEYFFTRSSGLTLKSHIIGLFAASVPLLLIYLFSKGRAMGLGDVYLMAGAGLFLGTTKAIVALAVGIFAGAIAGLILKKLGGDSKFAFGPWLSVGILVSMLCGWNIANLYLNLTGLGEMIYGEGYVSELPNYYYNIRNFIC